MEVLWSCNTQRAFHIIHWEVRHPIAPFNTTLEEPFIAAFKHVTLYLKAFSTESHFIRQNLRILLMLLILRSFPHRVPFRKLMFAFWMTFSKAPLTTQHCRPHTPWLGLINQIPLCVWLSFFDYGHWKSPFKDISVFSSRCLLRT